jgi:hypothetical protein
VYAAVPRKDVLVKVVIQKLVSLLNVKLQETQEKAEETAADAVVDNDKLETPETPESIPLGRQRRITAGIRLIVSFVLEISEFYGKISHRVRGSEE